MALGERVSVFGDVLFEIGQGGSITRCVVTCAPWPNHLSYVPPQGWEGVWATMGALPTYRCSRTYLRGDCLAMTCFKPGVSLGARPQRISYERGKP